MNICIHDYYDIFNHENGIFSPKLYELVEGGEKVFILLRNMMALQGHSLATMDQFPFETFEKFLFIDFPTSNVDLLHMLVSKKKELYLVLFESEIIKPDNWNFENYRFFTKVFGWKPVVHACYTRLMIPQKSRKSNFARFVLGPQASLLDC